jgi:hypothetical protein
MTAPSIIAARQQRALTELTAILERHDPEAAVRLTKAKHGSASVPTSPKRPLENATYMAESMLILARIVDEQLTPKKRGRPRRAGQSRDGSQVNL